MFVDARALANPSDFSWLILIQAVKAVERKINERVRPAVTTGSTGLMRRPQSRPPAGHGVDQLQTDYASGLRLLVTLSGLLLLIACANVANLLLARGSSNRSQTAVRWLWGRPERRSADAHR